MSKYIIKVYLKDMTKQLTDRKLLKSKEEKAQLLIELETQLEILDLLSKKYKKDYLNEKIFFQKIQEFVLLDEFVQAVNYINKVLRNMTNIRVEAYN